MVRPVVRVDPYVQLNPLAPFSERFTVQNGGNFSIHEVKVDCTVLNATSDLHVIYENSQLSKYWYRREMTAGDSETVDCPVDSVERRRKVGLGSHSI